MTEDEETGIAQRQVPEPTEVIDSGRTQQAALAWSQADADEVVPYIKRRSYWRWAASAATVLAGVGAALVLFHKPAAPTAHPTAAPPPPPPKGPIDGAYRVDHYRGEGVIRMPNGYVTKADAETSTVATEWWALQSQCDPHSCTAVGTRLDDDTHHTAANKSVPKLPAGEATQTLQLINGQWRSTSHNIIKQECASSHDQETWHWSLELYPLPDGTLKGQETDVIESNECHTLGKTVTTPTVATRIGDLPPGLPPVKAK
jgi:serine/threonine-protein kinase